MKKKPKKLSLNTETLRNLSEPNLGEVAGAQTIFESDMTKCHTTPCTFCTRAGSVCTKVCTVCCAA